MTPGDVKRQVARERGMTLDELTGTCRLAGFVAARWEAVARLHETFPQMSLPAIALQFGDMDHTSVLHALRKLNAGRYADGQPRKVIMTPIDRSRIRNRSGVPVIPDREEVRRLYMTEGLTLDETARRVGCRRSSVVACFTRDEIFEQARIRAAARQPAPKEDPLSRTACARAGVEHLIDFKRAGHTAEWYRANCEISELEDARERRRLGGQPRIVVSKHEERSWGGSPAGMCAV